MTLLSDVLAGLADDFSIARHIDRGGVVSGVVLDSRRVRPAVTGQILTVFGCGGDRDRAKRPIMGRIAAELSDQIIITTDNPRTEDPDQIITEIIAGATEYGHRVRAIPDRTQAISAALAAASPGDLVLIAGKGSETYQIVGHTKIPYSDEIAVLSLTSDGAA